MFRNSNYGDNFIEQEKFIKLCDELDVKLINHSNDKKWLEFLEKSEVLYPQKRIIIPSGYEKIIFDINHNPQNKYYNQRVIRIPDRYNLVDKLLDKIVFNGIDNRDYFHILYKKNSLTRKYSNNPIDNRFRKWDSYEIVVSNLGGNNHSQNRAQNFYAYWQAYYPYEINEACTQKYVANIFNDKIAREIWEPHGFPKKYFRKTLPLKYEFGKGDFLGRNADFEQLAFYIETIDKLRSHIIFNTNRFTTDKEGVLDIPSFSLYREDQKRVARVTKGRYKRSSEQLIDFAKFLCKKFYEYKEEKKDKLIDFLQWDVHYLIKLLQDGYELELETIKEKVGKIIFPKDKYSLDVIFPDEFEEEKHMFKYNLPSYLNQKYTLNKVKAVPKDRIEKFISFIEKNNLQLLFHSIGYSELAMSRSKQSLLRVMYLSLVLESLVKIILKEKKSLSTESIEKYGGLGKVISMIFKNEGWISTLKHHWPACTTVTPNTNIDRLLLDKIIPTQFHSNNDWENIIKMFLIAGLARNISAHDHASINIIRNDTYLYLLNNTVASIWYVWDSSNS